VGTGLLFRQPSDDLDRDLGVVVAIATVRPWSHLWWTYRAAFSAIAAADRQCARQPRVYLRLFISLPIQRVKHVDHSTCQVRGVLPQLARHLGTPRPTLSQIRKYDSGPRVCHDVQACVAG
jgi:hypothetical protein